jgi:hypothetical protein
MGNGRLPSEAVKKSAAGAQLSGDAGTLGAVIGGDRDDYGDNTGLPPLSGVL